ncbi:MAG: hypothetical protein HBSIN02_04240 [Bacteroidia bacterium]|nr:MAG: hypothetical protein HBSIN02_04240 [Bacteroidia bacterium]
MTQIRQPEDPHMNRIQIPSALIILAFLLVCKSFASEIHTDPRGGSYDTLLVLFRELRTLERPSLPNGVPDYTAKTMRRIHDRLMALRSRLESVDPKGWPRDRQADYELVRAEMNALDFHVRVLQPWTRDPAFYAIVWTDQSDTPDHEGPTSHAAIELWQYAFPLSSESENRLSTQLKIIPPLLEQARGNLTGNARDLWIAGIRDIHGQVRALDALAEKTREASFDFRRALAKAREAMVAFAGWLESEAPSKTGPSGIGKEHYTWHLRNVLLVPMSWEEEESLLRRELTRAYAMLKLEQHHNRNLPPLKPIATPEEYAQRTDEAIRKLIAFLDKQEILPIRDYMEPALREHRGTFQPDTQRNFFSAILHHEPNALFTHSTHWIDLARIRKEPHPSPIRRTPLPFNLWMHRSEGLATGVEEMFMHAGLYDDNPRARELVWVMLAQRCARGLASLYVHANTMTLDQAKVFQIAWTPTGWVERDLGLEGFEQQLYLRMPGYGTCYVTGKYLIERLFMDRSRELGDGFTVKRFFEELYSAGDIPVELIRKQMLDSP